MNIPPTNAFSKIIIGHKSWSASDYSSSANITGYSGNVTGTGSLTCSYSNGLFTCNLKQISCPVLQGIKGVDAGGNLFCAAI